MQDRFQEMFGVPPVWRLRAPARINILGEHIDYVRYLPTAALTFGSREHAMTMAVRPNSTRQVRGATTDDRFPPATFDLLPDAAHPDWQPFLEAQGTPAPHWINYVKGAVYQAQLSLGFREGFDFLVDSQIPADSGASSSSALTVLAAAAMRLVNGGTVEPEPLARAAAQAEWYVGTRGGAMDHLTICLARPHQCLHIAFDTGAVTPMALPEACWLTVFTHPAHKGDAVMRAYNERTFSARTLIPRLLEEHFRQEPARQRAWQQALDRWHQGDDRALAGLSETLAAGLPPCWSGGGETPEAGQPAAPPVPVAAYTAHHLGEVGRVQAARRLLQALAAHALPEEDVRQALGRLMDQSHDSLRDQYGVSTPDVETVRSALRAQSGVYGARLMGAGFGGNVLALVHPEAVAAVQATVKNGLVSTPGQGLTWA